MTDDGPTAITITIAICYAQVLRHAHVLVSIQQCSGLSWPHACTTDHDANLIRAAAAAPIMPALLPVCAGTMRHVGGWIVQ